MIPKAEQLRAISQMTQGDLSEIPFPVLLHALAVHERSVVLGIERRQLKKEIILENGIPVDCESNLLQDTLGKFMVGRGDITEEQNLQVLSKSATTGKPFGELLVAEGLLSPDELYKILQLSLAKKLLDSFTWREGTFHVSSQLPSVDSPLKVKAPQLVLTGVSKFAPEDEVAQAMEPFVGEKFFINPRPPFPLKELKLTKEQQEILALTSLGKTIEELEGESNLPRNKVLRLLYALSIIGVALPEAWLADGGRPKVEPALDLDFAHGTLEDEAGKQAPVATTEAPGLDNVVEIRNDVMETYLRYRKLDAIELLGVSDDPERNEVEQAFVDYSEKFAPWKFEHPELKNLQEKARDLFLAGGRAFGELTHPETRNSLVARRRSPLRQVSAEEARNAFAIKSNLLDSETQFEKGIALMEAGKYAEAAGQLQFAYDCEPQNSRYRAELAFCRYRKDPQIERDRSLLELQETVRIDPDCGLALYYLGTLHGEAGEFAEAEPWLQKAIKLMAPDRRPIEALKQFKVAEREKPRKKRLFF